MARSESVPIGDQAPSLGKAMRQTPSDKHAAGEADLSKAMRQGANKKHAGNHSLRTAMKQ